MAANQFNLGNNNAGLLPPVGAAAAPAGEIPAADLLYPIPAEHIDEIREYVDQQRVVAEMANLNGFADSYVILLTLIDGNPISEAQKAVLLENLPHIRSNLEQELTFNFESLVIDFNPLGISVDIDKLLLVYMTLNKLDGRPRDYVFSGPPKHDEPEVAEADKALFTNIVSKLFDKVTRLVDFEIEPIDYPEALLSAQELLPMIEGAEEHISIEMYPRDPILTFLITYFDEKAAIIMADEGIGLDVLNALREKCIEVREFRKAVAAPAAAEAAVAQEALIYPFQGDMDELNQWLSKLSREAFDDDNEPKAKQWDTLRKVLKGEALPEDENKQSLIDGWEDLYTDIEYTLKQTFMSLLSLDEFGRYDDPLQVGIAVLKAMNKKVALAENDVFGGVAKPGETKIPQDKKQEFMEAIDGLLTFLNDTLEDVDPIAENIRQDNIAYLLELFVSAKQKIQEGTLLDGISIYLSLIHI